jgi:hypothetical protein
MDDRYQAAPCYEIVEYDGKRDPEVAALILGIQRVDVGLVVPIEEQPELLDLGDAYRDGGFWLAVVGGEIVGTIGMMPFGTVGVLKKLFVRDDCRGPGGASHGLYATAIAWAAARELTAILSGCTVARNPCACLLRASGLPHRGSLRIADRL